MKVDDRTSTGAATTPEVGNAEVTRAEGGSEAEPSAESEGDEGVPPLPLDQVFEIAKNERRRHALRFLRDQEGPAELGTLAERIAAVENDTTVDAISSQERKRVYVGLYQCHLPKMDDMDIVEFNQNRGLIELGPNAEQIYPYIDHDDSPSVEWPHLYLGLSVVGAALLLGSLTVGSSIGFTPAIASALYLAAVGVTAVLHAQS
jgi:hypothetical protein